jgi:hypothetical protein
MVVHYFNPKRMPIMPFEANSPLVVNSNAPLPTSIARQLFESIGGRDLEVRHTCRAMQHAQLP